MISIILASLLTIDGGGEYVTYVDLEWPVANPLQADPGLVVYSHAHDNYVGPGATELVGWDGGAIVDERGLRTVRGLPGTPSVWYGASTSAWDDASDAGFKVEFCHETDFSTAEGGSHAGPDWSGTNYALDIVDGSSHSLFVGFGHAAADLLYCRVGNGAGETTLQAVTPIVPGGVYCTSVEGMALGYGSCALWLRHDRCAGSASGCRATTLRDAASGRCPNSWAAFLFGQRYTSTADSSQHVQSLRVGRPK